MLALCWPYVSPMLAHVGPTLALCWPKLTLCWPKLALCWAKLTLSCPYVGPMFAYVGLGNANPHSSDGTRGSAAGAALLYNLRVPPKASGKDMGCGLLPAPGFVNAKLVFASSDHVLK